MTDIVVGIQIIGTAGHHQAVQIRTGFSPTHRRREHPIFSSCGKRPNIPLSVIIINTDIPIFKIGP